MNKAILIAGAGILALAAGVGGYKLMAGAPSIPRGGCPALVSVAPYDANFLAYGDIATLRNSAFKQQMNSMNAMSAGQMPPEYKEFVENTNFHVEKDLDRVMLAGSIESAVGAVVLEGHFDQPKIISYISKMGKMTHYESGDVYLFPTGMPTGTAALMFLGPNRVALTFGKSAETQALILADAAKGAESSLHDDICARAERVSGAPFFMVGDIPKTGMLAAAAASAPADTGARDILANMSAWDVAFWNEGDSVRIALEGEYSDRIAALKARLAFEKVRDTIQKAETQAKTSPANAAAGPVLDSLVKNFGISLDGRFVRISTSLSRSDIEALQRAAASATPAARPAPALAPPPPPARRSRGN
jgi:hypothetical protein